MYAMAASRHARRVAPRVGSLKPTLALSVYANWRNDDTATLRVRREPREKSSSGCGSYTW